MVIIERLIAYTINVRAKNTRYRRRPDPRLERKSFLLLSRVSLAETLSADAAATIINHRA